MTDDCRGAICSEANEFVRFPKYRHLCLIGQCVERGNVHDDDLVRGSADEFFDVCHFFEMRAVSMAVPKQLRLIVPLESAAGE